MPTQWDARSKRKRDTSDIPDNTKRLKQSVELKRKREVTDVGGTPKVQRVSQSPQSSKATRATKRGQKNRPNRGRKPPNNTNGRNTSSNPQCLGRYPVTSYPEGNPQHGSPNIPNNPKTQNALENPQNISADPSPNIQKGNLGKRRPSAKFPYSENYPEPNGPKKSRRDQQPKSCNNPGNVGPRQEKNKGNQGVRLTNRRNNQKGVEAPPDSQNGSAHPVASRPEETSSKPEGLQTSASPQTFRTSTPRPISAQQVVSLRKQIYQERPTPSRRYSTGELPVRNKLSNKFVMGIPKQRFGIGRRRGSNASAPHVMTAEYCDDPYRTAIRERLAAGQPRAPPRSEFANHSDNYHAAGKVSKSITRLQESEEPGLMKQTMSLISGMAYKQYFELRAEMQVCWIGYDELVSFLGHRQAIEDTGKAAERFFRAALRTTGMRSIRRRANRQKGRDHIKAGRVQKPKKNHLRANMRELERGI